MRYDSGYIEYSVVGKEGEWGFFVYLGVRFDFSIGEVLRLIVRVSKVRCGFGNRVWVGVGEFLLGR